MYLKGKNSVLLNDLKYMLCLYNVPMHVNSILQFRMYADISDQANKFSYHFCFLSNYGHNI